jgi:stage V sporulation protein G
MKLAKKEPREPRNIFDVLTVTTVQVFPLKESLGKTKAIARAVINEQLQLTGLRVVDGAHGLFVSYPNDPSHKGEDYRSIFYPLTKELREHVEHCVLEKYQEKTVA